MWPACSSISSCLATSSLKPGCRYLQRSGARPSGGPDCCPEQAQAACLGRRAQQEQPRGAAGRRGSHVVVHRSKLSASFLLHAAGWWSPPAPASPDGLPIGKPRRCPRAQLVDGRAWHAACTLAGAGPAAAHPVLDVQVHGRTHGQQLQRTLEQGEALEADQDGDRQQDDHLRRRVGVLPGRCCSCTAPTGVLQGGRRQRHGASCWAGQCRQPTRMAA